MYHYFVSYFIIVGTNSFPGNLVISLEWPITHLEHFDAIQDRIKADNPFVDRAIIISYQLLRKDDV